MFQTVVFIISAFLLLAVLLKIAPSVANLIVALCELVYTIIQYFIYPIIVIGIIYVIIKII